MLQVVLSSQDSIAPVGILHPISFEVQHKPQLQQQQQQQQGLEDHLQQQQPVELTDAAAAVRTAAGTSNAAAGSPHVVEVPDDWLPEMILEAPAAAAAVVNCGAHSGGDNGVREGPSGKPSQILSSVSSWESRDHIHIISRGQIQETLDTIQQQQQQQEQVQGAKRLQKQQEQQNGGHDGGLVLGPEVTAAAMHAALSGVGQEMQQWPGLSWQHSVFVHLYLRDMEHFAAANQAYCQNLPQVGPPARACVQVRDQGGERGRRKRGGGP
jgi:hypothetical protein